MPEIIDGIEKQKRIARQMRKTANLGPMSFKHRFDSAVTEASGNEKDWAGEFSENDRRYAETKRGEDSPTGQSQIYINKQKLEDAGATEGYMKDMLTGEGLHLLKDIDPQRHNSIVSTALAEPTVMEWAQDSYKHEVMRGETRQFMDWFINSRLDQVIGGYMFGGKESPIPTMRGWSTGTLPYGTKFKKELERLKSDLGR